MNSENYPATKDICPVIESLVISGKQYPVISGKQEIHPMLLRKLFCSIKFCPKFIFRHFKIFMLKHKHKHK